MTEPSIAIAAAIAKDLGETDSNSLQQLTAIVAHVGQQEALLLLGRTLIVEGEGGLLVADGSRRRSPGGVFFHLARQVLSRDAKQRIFYGKGQPKPAGEELLPQKRTVVPQPRRRVVDVSALRRPGSNDEQRVLPGVTSSSRSSEVERARREMKAALLPLTPVLQRELLVDLCSTLNLQASEVAAAFVNGTATELRRPSEIREPLLTELSGNTASLRFINTRLILSIGVDLFSAVPRDDADPTRVKVTLETLRKMGFLQSEARR